MNKEFESAIRTIYTQLYHIEKSVKAYDDNTDDINWGHVGDLFHVTSQLQDVINFLEGND